MADEASTSDPRPLVVLPALAAIGRAVVWAGAKAWPWISRGGAALRRMLWRHRAVVLALAVRAAWVTALLVLVDAGVQMVQIEHTYDPMELRNAFALGLGLCSLTVLLASHRRIRWAGVALGTAHGALVLVLTAIAS